MLEFMPFLKLFEYLNNLSNEVLCVVILISLSYIIKHHTSTFFQKLKEYLEKLIVDELKEVVRQIGESRVQINTMDFRLKLIEMEQEKIKQSIENVKKSINQI